MKPIERSPMATTPASTPGPMIETSSRAQISELIERDETMIKSAMGRAIYRLGVVAIGLRSIGFIAKLLYEAIEEIDQTQVEAVTASGASQAQVIDFAIVPQILPSFFGITVFRWDINIRESTILGLVGAGGIGLQLQASMNVLAWPQVTMIFVIILATVVVSEWISAKVRHAII